MNLFLPEIERLADPNANSGAAAYETIAKLMTTVLPVLAYIAHGSSSPENSVPGTAGTMYFQTDTSGNVTIWIKTGAPGNTGWTKFVNLPAAKAAVGPSIGTGIFPSPTTSITLGDVATSVTKTIRSPHDPAFATFLDNVPNGTRAAWDTGAQKTAAVNVTGDLLFKNVNSTSITAGTTILTTVTAIPNSITVTTHGFPVALLAVITCTGGGSAPDTMQPYFYRDGNPITGSAAFGTCWFAMGAQDTKTLLWLDNAPAAGSHNYELHGLSLSNLMTTNGGTLFVWEFA